MHPLNGVKKSDCINLKRTCCVSCTKNIFIIDSFGEKPFEIFIFFMLEVLSDKLRHLYAFNAL